MNKKEYENKRAALMNAAKECLDKGDIEGFNAKKAEIETLDSDFETQAQAQADYMALAGGRPAALGAILENAENLGKGTVIAMQDLSGGPVGATDPLDSNEYKNAFMNYVCRGTPIPAELRNCNTLRLTNVAETTTTGDVPVMIPTTTSRKIIQELTSHGGVYNSVRKINVQGGVEFPILDLMPEAHWIDEATPSEDQKMTADQKVSFSYHGLECKISQSLLVRAVTFEEFQALFVPLATKAIIRKIEAGIFNADGSGKMLGVTKDPRVTNIITLKAADMSKWDGWKKNVFAKIKISYGAGRFYMAKGTWDSYIDGMVDNVGQPMGRVNYGISDAGTMRFGGKAVELVEDDVIKPYDSAAAGDVIAVFMNPENYAINSNMEMTVVRWTDHDTNKVKTKVMTILDGKALDTNGIIIIKKGA